LTDRNPYAPPQAEVRDPPAAAEAADDLASRKSRFFGALVDGVASALVLGPLMFFTGTVQLMMAGQLTYRTSLVIAAEGIVVFLLLNSYLLATAGQTIGKRFVGTRIVNVSDGRVPKFLTLVGARYGSNWVIGLIPGIGNVYGLADALFVFRADRRCVHDLIAGTKVVNA
jgi:uncharacterized RDD family membrane protein YckC